ncbi:hypothetical protein [Methylobacterium sp. NEAU K]|nr:hypothetical protein [Methylobacterium sp. NEAU K]MDP4004430.1 hypothetical protein [Methylobacterium sp. NEAU K]
MSKSLRFLRNWFLLSIPVGLFVGKFIKAGKGPLLRDDERSSDS